MANNKNYKASPQKAVTTRIPLADYGYLLTEAERRGTTVADMLRISCAGFREQQTFDERMRQMEARLKRYNFEIVCAVSGLTDTERKEALRDVQLRLREVRS